MKYKWYWTPGWWWRLLIVLTLWVGGGILIEIDWGWIGGILVIVGLGFFLYGYVLTGRNIAKKEKEEISVFKVPRDELVRNGYRYYCRECGAAYQELAFELVNGVLNTKMCSCGTNSFATLNDNKPVWENEEQR